MAADFNNDSLLAIVFVDYSINNLGTVFRYGNQTFENLTMFSTENGSCSVCIAIVDFNNTNRFDITILNFGTNNVYIFIVGEYGSFSLFMIYSTENGSGPKRILVVGLNQVNRLDVIIPTV
jgi:hypothetical protein